MRAQEFARWWLRENGHSALSLCEVVLVDDSFADVRSEVSVANVFISHMDREPLLGVSGSLGAEHGMEDMSTFQQLWEINYALSEFNVEKRYCWLDYTSLRACQQVRQSRAMCFLVLTDAVFFSGV